MNYSGFFLVILLSNIIQGITGFAGTILAMPPSLMLVGYDTAKPVLNVLGLLSGIYVFAGYGRRVCWKEFRKIVAVMTVGILGGILIKDHFFGSQQPLYKCLGIFVLILAAQGLRKIWKEGKGFDRQGKALAEGLCPWRNILTQYGLLILAGAAHGIFVSGGPVLIGYLAGRVKDKVSFRATISTVWVVLNTLILLDDIRAGLWSLPLLKVQAVSIPFLLTGMFIGSRLYARMSQRLFMMLTYILLLLSGLSLLVK